MAQASYTLQGKIALVSGSAMGIGAATCVELASRGARVIVNYPWPCQKNEAEVVLHKIRQSKGPLAADAFAVEADLSTLEGPPKLVQEAVAKTGGRIDILINNAGIAIMEPLENITSEQWDKQVNLNGRGLMLLTQAALPYLSQNSRITAGKEFLDKIQPMLDVTPMGSRMAEPEEIAFAIAFFCEPKAQWITGVCMGVNGGFLMS
ncbi:short chain type dehydrogenase [Fusarium acutatum]|uniref:Short chain type dehydrogenase n=1 Tax=Fusarium acutatum TaxID=78861 RepID=A0A8H4JUB1_9HYPO|nr:short chain type dehydrogenase [Fusarium acutatum]